MTTSPGPLRRLDATGWPQLAARLGFGGVMIAFAVPKIADPLDFLKQLHNYNILPSEPVVLLNLIAVCLPWVELLGALALILGVARRSMSAMFTVLMLVFTAAVLYRAQLMHLEVGGAFCDIKFDCGCGQGEVFICAKTLENLGLILLALYIFLSRSNKLNLTQVLAKRPTPQ